MNDHYVEILEQYEGETISVRRGRGAWICERTEGIRLLKEYRGTLKRLEFEESVLKSLRESGMERVDQYVRNQENSLIAVGSDGTKYVLKEWYLDRECNLKDAREILTAVSRIAGLHKAFCDIPWQEDWNSGSMILPGLGEEMKRHTREMKRVRNFISGKRKKSDFELCVMGDFEAFMGQALEAQAGLELLEKERKDERLFLCHGDLDQHHILIGERDVDFIEFNQMHRGDQMADLYRFMRKVMEKHDWNDRLGASMMETYDRILPLCREDRERLYYLFLYPEKYWKQLNYYYNANKAWIPAKSVEKLRTLEAQQEMREKFLTKIR